MDIAAIISVLQVVVANLPGAVTTAEALVDLGTKFYESVNGHAPSIEEIAALRAAVDNDVATALTPLPPAQQGDCMKAANEESEKLQKDLKSRTDAATAEYEQKRPHGPLTCLDWTLAGNAKGLSGEARCGEDATAKLVGTANYLGPAAK